MMVEFASGSEDNYFLENKEFITKEPVFEKYLLDLYPNMKVTVNHNIKDIISKLENNEIDGYIIDNITADRIIQDFGYGRFKISGFIGNENPIRGAFAVINSKPELLEIINLGIKSFSKKELASIKESWKITRYGTVIDNSLTWRIITIFIIIFSIFKNISSTTTIFTSNITPCFKYFFINTTYIYFFTIF